MTPPLSIPNVSPEQIARLRSELAKDAATKVDSTGENQYRVTGHGVDASVTYLPSVRILKIQVASKPFYVSANMIHDQIVKALGC